MKYQMQNSFSSDLTARTLCLYKSIIDACVYNVHVHTCTMHKHVHVPVNIQNLIEKSILSV